MENMKVNLQKVKKLTDKFNENLHQYRLDLYNETEVRVDFVNPFFELLGWDILNIRGLPQHLREVKHEAAVMVEENGEKKKKKPDYSFKAGAEVCFFLETKKPSVDIVNGKEPAFQLRRYGWNGNLKISILTNFTDLLIYDCSIRPVETDETNVALVAHYHYTEYASKFDELYNLISRDAVISGNFDRQFSSISSTLKKEPFDSYFLGQIKNWRNVLSLDIVQHNNVVNDDDLNIFVQRILNRIIFLRICEDRNFEEYETIKRITTYLHLKELFKCADNKYDSGLFDLIDDGDIVVSDSVIIGIFQDLYYPNSSYEFSVVDPYIIGEIYALFLEETVSICADHKIEIIKKPEVIDSEGAVNTPKNITEIVVKETLAPLYDGKSLHEVENYRIADICCGAGNFLLSAFEYIINFYIAAFLKEDQDGAIHRGDIYVSNDKQGFALSYALKRKILIRNIWGVDIDPLAVEVTKLSLLLKVLEGSFAEEIAAFSSTTHLKILPNLDQNIKNGNSLVDTAYSAFDSRIFEKIDLLTRLKMFDWKTEFNNQTFDAVIGNPPYIRVQNMVHYSLEEYQYYKSSYCGFETSNAELLDKYYLFIERGISLLKSEGLLGYIVPHKFMQIKSGRVLRGWLSQNGYVKKILHFGTNQVFQGRSTYTCILVLSKCRRRDFEISFIQDWNRFLCEHKTNCDLYNANYLSAQPWVFLSDKIKRALAKAKPYCVSLNTVAEIFVGLQTSNDAVYIINKEAEDTTYLYFKDKNHLEHKIEKGLLKKCIYDLKIKKYEKIEANRYIIFPYKKVNGHPKIYTLDEMKSQFPCGYKYLVTFQKELCQRKMPGRNEDNWFGYGRSQSIRRFSNGEHLIWPVLSTESNYVFDNESIAFTGGGNGPYYGLQMKADTKESIFYIQAILNHWLLEHLVKSKASAFRGDYYSHGKQFIETLPIYKINFDDEEQKALHDRIVEMTQSIMTLSEKKKHCATGKQQTIIDRAIEVEQQQIGEMIDALYGVGQEKIGEQI